jgi:4-hydroxy-2-oxoheptanedioate aldolase
MRSRRSRSASEAGSPVVAIHATTADPDVVEICAASGADAYVVDLEHGTASNEACAGAVRAGEAFGIGVVFRLSLATLHRVGPLVDARATGVVVADVRGAADCARAADAVFHSPFGRRGFGGCRENAYGLQAPSAQSLRPTTPRGPGGGPFLAVQVESNAGLMAIDEILGSPGVAMVSVGTRDLAADIGHPGELEHPDVRDAASRIAAATHRQGIAFAHMVRAPEEVGAAFALRPDWILVPLAVVIRTGISDFTRRLESQTVVPLAP